MGRGAEMGQGARGLTAQIKDRLIQKTLERRLTQLEQTPVRTVVESGIPERFYRWDLHPGYQQVRLLQEGAARFGVENPFFKVHEGTASAHSRIVEKTVVNYASYNYLGLSGHPLVNAAAKEAIDRYGTSVSASRIVSGERPLHAQLERAIAQAYGVDDAIVMVSGHATNVTSIGYLFGPNDLVLHDEYAHNSIIQGISLAGAKRLCFPHNDLEALEQILTQQRRQAERVLVVVEGIYSMDGGLPRPAPVYRDQASRALLMVDEAHSFGVLGRHGMGIREHFDLDPKDVDIWMGTLSKALAACGGYIAGASALVENLRYLAPGFLYSVGMAPPVAAAALSALQVLQAEPQRVSTLQQRSRYFLEKARGVGLQTGASTGNAIVPVITGSSLRAVRLSNWLLERGIHVQPILYPAVPERQARLRFFLSSEHTLEDIDETMTILAEDLRA
ncbi:8-amino-7-oxononanoate synthase, putative [Acidithiobacillus sp. GGI-221]|nr:8-amino-7-oxononanoate synthase, putative [Acidithiobacillus sp. GGI-221]